MALQASVGYSLAGSTVSDLGNVGCRQVRGDLLCSPWHTGMNAAFIWFGCTLIVGALLLGRRMLLGRAGAAAVALWCVSGLGSIGVGLFPVDQDPGMHSLVALPIFVAQPLALALMAVSLRDRHAALARGSLWIAAISTVGAIGFGLLVGTDSPVIGAVERLALWPGYLWVAVVALSCRRSHLVSQHADPAHL